MAHKFSKDLKMIKRKTGGATFQCKWCLWPSVIKQGRINLCEKHYRFQQMRVNAKRHKKTVPSYKELGKMQWAVCPICFRTMNWLGIHGKSTVVTLQHDNNGKMTLLCRACNTRHGGMGDEIYGLKRDQKWCPRCEKILELNKFSMDRSGRYGNRKTYCKKCSYKYWKEWKSRKS